MSNRVTRLFTEPLIQFLIIGACIYGAYALFGAPEEDFRDTRVHVDSARINAFISQWESRWNRPPTREEIDGLIQSYIKEDVLYRQAVAMGLNEDDPITRRRMAQKLEFLTSDLAMMVQPAEDELEQFFSDNSEVYRAPDRMTFSQIFFDPDSRGNTTLEDAAEALAQLQAAGVPTEESMQMGDGFMLQSDFVSVTEAEAARQMGSGFVEAVVQLEPESWHGPVLSGYGVHLVYMYDFQKSPPAVFEDVQAAVLENWQLEQREKFNADFLENLKTRYEIVIDEIPAERILKVPDTTATNENPVKATAS
ncbi:MAG: peptidylprolyl isomerase [Xanthomonadales bacterium]|nr:peptidylprolyl isomerase [Xanthomonadales bacterium]